MRLRRLFAVAVTAAALSLSSVASASPEDIFGYGPRNVAMGGTGTAIGEGAETTWSNPALLSLGRERELSIGFQAARFDLYANGGALPGAMHPEPMKGTLIGALLPLPFGGFLRDRIALGFGFYTPTNVIVRGRVLYPETPSFATLADRTQSVSVQAGIGLDLGYGVRVGGGFAALAAIAGDVVVATDSSGQVGTKVDDQLVASYAKVFGVTYDFLDDFRVGVRYRSELEARFAVAIEVHDLGQLVVPTLNIAGVAQYDPRQIAFEVARVRGPVKAAIGVTLKHWSAYPGAPEATVLCPPEEPQCLAPKPAAPGFHDTVVPRIGVEAELAKGEGFTLLGRAGAFYEPSPAPPQTSMANGFDDSRAVLTLGYGVDLREPYVPIRVDLFGQLHELVKREHVKDANVDPSNPGYPKATTGGSVVMAGLALTVKF